MREEDCPGTAATVRRAEKKGQEAFPLQNTIRPTIRQVIKRRIVCACCQGYIPAWLAQGLLSLGGLSHD